MGLLRLLLLRSMASDCTERWWTSLLFFLTGALALRLTAPPPALALPGLKMGVMVMEAEAADASSEGGSSMPWCVCRGRSSTEDMVPSSILFFLWEFTCLLPALLALNKLTEEEEEEGEEGVFLLSARLPGLKQRRRRR